MFSMADFDKIIEEYESSDDLREGTIRNICKKNGVLFGSFWHFLGKNPELFERYARAKEFRAHADFDLLHDFALEDMPKIVLEGGETKIDPSAVALHRLRVDSLKWIVARKNQKYADTSKVDASITAKVETIVVPDFSERPE